MKYKKKPVIIEAVQWNGFTVSEDVDWIIQALHEGTIKINFDKTINDGYVLEIKTPEGTMNGIKNDYIIKGVNGKLYPCKPDIFEKTYERI